MTSTNRKAWFLDAAESASPDQPPVRLRLVSDRAHQEPETASEATLESPILSEERSAHRWHALDGLLSDSFGRISPAYLFMCFPPSR